MTTDKPIILFDGVCNFCNRMVNLQSVMTKKQSSFSRSYNPPIYEQLKKEYQVATDADTIVFIEKGKAYTYARAAIRVCRYLNWPAKLLYAFVIVPRFISQPVYKWIARNRYKWFGKKDSCMIPTAEIKKRFLE